MPVINDGPPSVAVFTAAATRADDGAERTRDADHRHAGRDRRGRAGLISRSCSPTGRIADDRVPILAGLDAIEARSMQDYKVVRREGDRRRSRTRLLTLAMNDQMPGGAAFFEAFRQLVITGYYTSEIGITQEREYLPVPGEYNGAFPYSKVNKVYSS